MTFPISLEAIEADLRIAERGGQVATIAMARAQIRATLLAAQPADHQGRHETPTVTGAYVGAGPDLGSGVEQSGAVETIGAGVTDIHIERSPYRDVLTVPTMATWEDRVTAAAMLLRLDRELLAKLLKPTAEPEAPTEDTRAGEPVEDVEDDDREILSFEESTEPWPENKPDDVDADFFAEARQARRKK